MPETPPPMLPTLPFHLALSLSAWISSTIASECLKSALPNVKQDKAGAALADLIEKLPAEVSALAQQNVRELLSGVERYRSLGYERTLPDLPVVWRKGNMRLLACHADEGTRGPVMLIIPSLINRHYVLDLAPGRSLVRHLAAQGVTSLVVDWGEPGADERGYNAADYVEELLFPVLDFVTETSGGALTVAGYCMGGVLALALAQLRQKQVSRLVLLATPWDFHSSDMAAPRLDKHLLAELQSFIDSVDALPPEWLQLMFYWSDPWLFQDKFRKFSELSPGSVAFREFVALERWVNDGVPLAKKVAHDCLVEWGQKNRLARGEWQVGGQRIRPEKLKIPTFVAVPSHDRIVPPNCAMPLSSLIPGATLCRPPLGHVGMIVAGKAKTSLWEPLSEWLTLQCSK